MKHMYIHIPFCKKICSYCDFCKMFYNNEFIDKYLDELNNEIINYYNGEEMETVYIGGGTPSSLSYDELNKLDKMPNVVEWNDKRAASQNFNKKEKIHQSFYDSGGFSVRQNINCLSFSAKVLIFHSLI